MTRIISLCTLVLTLAVSAEPGAPYANKDKSITTTLPAGWIAKDRFPGVSTFGPETAHADAAINEYVDVKAIDQPNPPLTLQQLGPRLAGSVGKTIPGCTVSDAEDTRIGKTIPAMKFTYSGTKDGDSLKGMKVFAIVGNRVYIVTYFADAKRFNEALPAAQSIIDSMTITPPAGK